MRKYTNQNFFIFGMEGVKDGPAVQAIRNPKGQTTCDQFFNLSIRVSQEVSEEGKDPGLMRYGIGKGAPYTQITKGIVRACCSNWDKPGGCSVSITSYFSLFFSLFLFM
jgi:hypothetical protein